MATKDGFNLTSFGYSPHSDLQAVSKIAIDQDVAILESLPHGSGIDADWHIDVTGKGKRAKIVASNSYHAMDEYGFYVGWVDFSIRWLPGDFANFRLMFHGRDSQYLAERHMLRDYLEDTIYHTLDYAKQALAES